MEENMMENILKNATKLCWKSKLKCAFCTGYFSIQREFRRPFVLQCGHSICEKCLYTFFRMSKKLVKIICEICSSQSTYAGETSFKTQLEINLHNLGHMVFRQYIYPHFAHQEANKQAATVNEKKSPASSEERCYECNVEFTQMTCVQCNAPFCQSCFDVTHRFGKIFQTHLLVPLSAQYGKTLDHGECRSHKSLAEFFCVDCQETACNTCNEQHHIGHTVAKMNEENIQLKPRLMETIEMVKAAKQMNESGSKDLRKALIQLQNNTIQTVSDVNEYFTYLHGILQIAENEILDQVKSKLQQFTDHVEIIENQLSETGRKYDEKISCLTHYSNNLPKYKRLLDEIDATNIFLTTATSCSVRISYDENSPYRFTGDSLDLKNYVNQHLSLEYNENWFETEFQAFAVNQFTMDKSVSPASSAAASAKSDKSGKVKKAALKLSPPEHRNNTGAIKKLYNKRKPVPLSSIWKEGKGEGAKATATVETPPVAVNNSVKSPKGITTQKVKVSHIKSPHHFYVQNQTFFNNAEKFAVEYEAVGPSAPKVDTVELGNCYLAYTKVNKWFRVMVTGEGSSANQKIARLLDFGNSAELDTSHFKHINDELLERPAGAILCSLYGVEPNNAEHKWSDHVVSLMAEIVACDILTMVMVNDSDPPEVDLISINTEYPLSVRDALLYEGLASSNLNSNDKIHTRLTEFKDKLFKDATVCFYPPSYTPITIVNVKVINSVNPQNFYAVQVESIALYDKMKEEMNSFYEKSFNKIYAPQIGMICATKAVDNKWYRAKIINLLPKRVVDVFLVDMGQQIEVAAKNLRYLERSFTTQSEAAILCCLADVRPLRKNGYKWLEEAIAYFKYITEMEDRLQLLILSVNKNSKGFGVTMFILRPKMEICINGLLVRKGFCESTGDESTVVEIPIFDDDTLDCLPAEQTILDFNATSASVMGLTALKRSAVVEKKKAQKNLRCQVKLTNVVSPGNFQVVLFKYEPALFEMDKRIQDMMKTDQTEHVDRLWDINDTCLAFGKAVTGDVPKWHRGKVVDFATDDKYKIYLRDVGLFLNVPLANLTECPIEFAEVTDGVISCHMAFVTTTMYDTTKWTHTSVDEFKSLVDTFEEVSLSLHGKAEDGSFPVIVWGMQSTFEDAFSPAISKFSNINKIMVDQGLVKQLEPLLTEIDRDQCIDLEEQIFLRGKNFDQWVQKITEAQVMEVRDQSDQMIPVESLMLHSLTSDITPIESWPSASPVNKQIFHGTPTYVDNNGVIYLHDAQQGLLMEHLKKTINDFMEQDDEIDATMVKGKKFRKNQPCLARFHIDDCFYRATVLKVIQRKPEERTSLNEHIVDYCVQYVDYGNVEVVRAKDLRSTVIAGNIPKQATKYRLINICPATEGNKGRWPTETLDGLHTIIVGRQCIIRVAGSLENGTDSIIPCFVKVLDINGDVSKLMVDKGLAVYDKNFKFTEDVDITWDKYLINYPMPPPVPLNRKDLLHSEFEVGESEHTLDDLINLFDRVKLSEIKKIVSQPFEEAQENVNTNHWQQQRFQLWQKYVAFPTSPDIDDEDDGEIAGSFVRRPPAHVLSSDDMNTTVQTECFEPLATSSEIGRPTPTPPPCPSMQTPIQLLYGNEIYPLLKLDKTTQSTFWAETTLMENPYTFYIFPHLAQHQQEHEFLAKQLQMLAKVAKPLNDVHPMTICMARFTDGNWYRAIVHSVKQDRGEVNVLYVDYLNMSIVKEADLRKLPSCLRNIPLRNIYVYLWSVRLNPRIRELDIANRMINLIEGCKQFVVVRGHQHIRQAVEFYIDESAIYRPYDVLFDDRFFLCG